MKIEWSKDLSVGNAVIDSDHRNLISLTHALISWRAHKVRIKVVNANASRKVCNAN